VAFIRAFRAGAMTQAALARSLDLRETEIRRMLDPAHGTKIERIEAGMRALGRRLVIEDEAA